MNSTLIILIAITCLASAVFLAIISLMRTTSVSPLMGFAVTAIVFTHIGFISYGYQHSFNGWAASAVLSVCLGLLSLCLGGVVGLAFFRVEPAWKSLTRHPIQVNLSYRVAMRTALLVFGTVSLYFVLLGYVPLITGLQTLYTQGFSQGLLNTLRVQRDVYVNEDAAYIPLAGFFESLRYFGLPVVAIWFLHFWRIGLRRWQSLLMVVLSCTLIVATGQRWPLMYLVVSLVFYWSWTENNAGRFQRAVKWLAVLSVFSAVVLSALLGRGAYSDYNLIEAAMFGLRDLYTRIFLGNVEVPFASYELFPEQEGWLSGASWKQNLIAYLPGPTPSYPVTFYKLVTGSRQGFTAPPDFFTEAYINFGWSGVAIIPFFWGLFLAYLQKLITKRGRTLVGISVYSMLTTLIAFSSISGIAFLLGGVVACVYVLGVLRSQRFIAAPPRKRLRPRLANSRVATAMR